MCGIVGYIGKENASKILIDLTRSLEYRGYDSAGIAIYDSKENKFLIKKTTGTIDRIKQEILNEIDGTTGISHTRWATHGKINEKNAYLSILIGLFIGFLLFPNPDFSKSILIGILFPISSFPPFMGESLLFLSFLFATFLPIFTWKLK